jgi:tetratricopeptide (TPR) repeat protein
MYFQGLIQKLNGDNEKAIHFYEQCIKLNMSDTATVKSIHDISIIKIEERDIYAAYYTIDRLETIPDSLAYLKNLKEFLEGAVSIIKKKFEDGVKLMDNLIKTDSETIHESVRPLLYSYRAYTNFSLGNIELALNDYNTLEKHGDLIIGDELNKYLCKGIIAADSKQFSKSMKYFEKAQLLQPAKIEPNFYIWIMKILEKIYENDQEFYNFVSMPQQSDEDSSHLKKQWSTSKRSCSPTTPAPT